MILMMVFPSAAIELSQFFDFPRYRLHECKRLCDSASIRVNNPSMTGLNPGTSWSGHTFAT